MQEVYSGNNEANMLRYKYLKKIKNAYKTHDFSDLFSDLAEDCEWSGTQGKDNVIDKLKSHAESMEEKNYHHPCYIVQVNESLSPIECNTKPDGTGKRVGLGLLYNEGEFCMIINFPWQQLFFRMDIAPNGKIKAFYATLPSGNVSLIE